MNALYSYRLFGGIAIIGVLTVGSLVGGILGSIVDHVFFVLTLTSVVRDLKFI